MAKVTGAMRRKAKTVLIANRSDPDIFASFITILANVPRAAVRQRKKKQQVSYWSAICRKK